MRSISRPDIVSAFDALDSTVSALLDMPFGALTTPERLRLLQRLERVRRRLPAVEHGLINQLRQQASQTELGGSLTHGLANRLLITRAEAARRIDEAHDLGERRAITGESLSPRLAVTADGQRAGDIGAGHVRVAVVQPMERLALVGERLAMVRHG